MEITTILKLLSDENRLRIMSILKNSSLCVGEIQTILNIKQSNTSSHLEKLKSYGLIISDKKAQWIYYKLYNEQLEKYSFIKQLLFEDLNNQSIFKEDLYKLNKYKASNLTCQDLKRIGYDFTKINFS